MATRAKQQCREPQSCAETGTGESLASLTSTVALAPKHLPQDLLVEALTFLSWRQICVWSGVGTRFKCAARTALHKVERVDWCNDDKFVAGVCRNGRSLRHIESLEAGGTVEVSNEDARFCRVFQVADYFQVPLQHLHCKY